MRAIRARWFPPEPFTPQILAVQFEADRTAKILPWDSQEEGRILSPVEASTRYLAHLRDLGAHQRHRRSITQQVVLTVPASFDEEARELTVQAAHDAGIDNLTLLEEPAAAFYAWIAGHLSRSNKELFDGQIVLVCDVGGGTSDLLSSASIAKAIASNSPAPPWAAISCSAATISISPSPGWPNRSSAKLCLLRQRSALRRQCSAAKEICFRRNAPESVDVTVVGAGSSLIGGTLKATITREEVLELALGGFLPPCELTDKPQQEKQSVFRELGLPYVSDPAITRHLAEFLTALRQLQNTASTPSCLMAASSFRKYFANACATWSSIGSAARRCSSKIRIWISRSPLARLIIPTCVPPAAACWFAAVCRAPISSVFRIPVHRPSATVCLVPRGTEEGQEIKLEQPEFELRRQYARRFSALQFVEPHRRSRRATSFRSTRRWRHARSRQRSAPALLRCRPSFASAKAASATCPSLWARA